MASVTANAWLALALAYLLGGIPVGLIVGLARGVDVRKVGSGNIGATNVIRGVGAKLGALVFIIDVLKGVAAVMIARALGADDWLVGMAGLFVVLGHSFSPYLAFKGGKGVATSFGVALGVAWLPALITFGLWLALVAPTRLVSLGSICGAAALPILVYAFDPGRPELVVPLVALAIIVIGRHNENIERLLRGEENRFGAPRPNAAVGADQRPEEGDADE